MSADLAELQRLLDDTATKSGVPGASVGVLHRGRETVLSTGVTSVDTGEPVDERTLFMIGSTTKTFTGALLVALAEDGLLELDKPVADHLPEFRLTDPVAQGVITARQLLTHTSGFLGDHVFETGWGEDALAAAVARFAELPQVFPPGEAFSYNNSGFVLAGRLAEVIAGDSYENLVRDRILAPLGMRDSVFLPWEVLPRKHAVGHQLIDGVPSVSATLGITRAAGPAGGLWSTARDQLRWARFFLTGDTGGGTAPISAAGRAAMWVPQRRAATPFEEIGLSWIRLRHGDAPIVRHGGNVSNLQVSEFVTLPEHELAVTVLTNSGGGGTLGPAVVDWCLENLAGLPRLAERPVLPVVEPAEYAGRYRTGALAFDIAVAGQGLTARMVFVGDDELPSPPAFEIAFVAEDVFSRAADTRRDSGRFLRDERGAVRALEFGGRTALRDR